MFAVSSSSLQYRKYMCKHSETVFFPPFSHQCFIGTSVLHWPSRQRVSEAQQLSSSIREMLAYDHNQPMALNTGSLYKQGQIRTSIAATWRERIRCMEAERKTRLRLFIAHERKQRQQSEPNRETHLKNSVRRIRSITSELSVMEVNKLTGN